MGLLATLFGKGNSEKAAARRKQEAWELGKEVGPDQIARLEKYLDDENLEVRRAAISSLEQQWPTGDSVGIRLLTEKLCDPHPQIRAVAALALGEFIPSAKTYGAKHQGDAAIQELLNLLEKETDESVLEFAFAALGNMDDPNLLASFSEIAHKLNKPTVYLGIRKISLLRLNGHAPANGLGLAGRRGETEPVACSRRSPRNRRLSWTEAREIQRRCACGSGGANGNAGSDCEHRDLEYVRCRGRRYEDC